nr:hypothetical protein [Tanacetum cinerariifolium]
TCESAISTALGATATGTGESVNDGGLKYSSNIAGVQIPENNLDNLQSINEEGTLELEDPQELLGSIVLATKDLFIVELLTGTLLLVVLDFLEYTNVITGLSVLLSIGELWDLWTFFKFTMETKILIIPLESKDTMNGLLRTMNSIILGLRLQLWSTSNQDIPKVVAERLGSLVCTKYWDQKACSADNSICGTNRDSKSVEVDLR